MAGVVHWSQSLHPALPLHGVSPALAQTAKGIKQERAPSNETLPRNVAETRDAILSAAGSGRFDELRSAFELNEMPPDVGQGPGEDALTHLLSLSNSRPVAAPAAPGDRPAPASAQVQPQQSAAADGRDILDALGKILALPPAAVAKGRDFENNAVYVWPYLAERDLARLSADDEAELKRLVGTDDAALIVEAKRWTYWRLAIGADGTWHSLSRGK